MLRQLSESIYSPLLLERGLVRKNWLPLPRLVQLFVILLVRQPLIRLLWIAWVLRCIFRLQALYLLGLVGRCAQTVREELSCAAREAASLRLRQLLHACEQLRVLVIEPQSTRKCARWQLPRSPMEVKS